MLQTLRIGVAMKELLLFNRFGSQMEIAGKTKQLNINIQQPLNHLRMYNSPLIQFHKKYHFLGFTIQESFTLLKWTYVLFVFNTFPTNKHKTYAIIVR